MNKTNSKKKRRVTFWGITSMVILAVTYGIIMYNMPHRDVQATATDQQIDAQTLVNEYLSNSTKANQKYLDEEGESTIFEVTGKISGISEDFDGLPVVLLKEKKDKAGVSCTFLKEVKPQIKSLKLGQKVTVKGVIRAGASYDADLEMYEHVIIEKCNVIK